MWKFRLIDLENICSLCFNFLDSYFLLFFVHIFSSVLFMILTSLFLLSRSLDVSMVFFCFHNSFFVDIFCLAVKFFTAHLCFGAAVTLPSLQTVCSTQEKKKHAMRNRAAVLSNAPKEKRFNTKSKKLIKCRRFVHKKVQHSRKKAVWKIFWQLTLIALLAILTVQWVAILFNFFVRAC